MNTIVELKSTDLNAITDLMKEYNGAFPCEFEFPSVMTVRLNNVGTRFGNLNAEITFRADMRNKVMDIHYQSYGFAVMAKEHARPFDMKVRLGRDFFDRVSFIEMPKDVELFRWLVQPTKNAFNGSNAEFIVFMCHCAGMAVGMFRFSLSSEVNGDKLIYRTLPNFYNLAKTGLEAQINKAYEEKLLDGWDCVNVTWEQFWKIDEMIEQDDLNTTFEHLTMNHFAVRLDETGHKDKMWDWSIYFFDIDPDLMTVDVSFSTSESVRTISDTFRMKFWYEVNTITGEKSLKWDFADPSSIPYETYKRLTDTEGSARDWSTMDFILMLFLYTNNFMLYYKDVATTVEERVCTNHSIGSHGKAKHRGAVRMFKSYTLKKNWKSEVKRKKAEIKCLAWGVRGHFRHYSNGKVIFVNPYIKGKERDKYQGKDYVLFPQNNAV